MTYGKKTRKCNICGQEIDLSFTDDYFIEPCGKTTKCMHVDCYIEKKTTAKRASKTKEECLEYIKKCQKTREEKDKVNNEKSALYLFLSEMYGISFFPEYFFVKMSSVFSGKYKGLNKPVLPEDLLDMWKQKKSYLEKLADRNKRNGKEMNALSQLFYDLAVLLSKYDSYLQWKEQQKLAMVEVEERVQQNTDFIGYNELIRVQNGAKNNVKTTNIDISSMIDEI